MKKKIITSILTLALLVSCTAAFAATANPKACRGQKSGHRQYGIHKMKRNMSPEDKAQFSKLRTLGKELREEMKKENPDKTKAMSLKKQIADIRCEMSQKRFEKMLDNPKFGKHHKKLPEAQKARFMKMHELRKAMCEEFWKEQPDKEKLMQLNKEMLELKKEASLEHFKTRLDNPKKGGKGCKKHSRAAHGRHHRGHHGFDRMRGCPVLGEF